MNKFHRSFKSTIKTMNQLQIVSLQKNLGSNQMLRMMGEQFI